MLIWISNVCGFIELLEVVYMFLPYQDVKWCHCCIFHSYLLLMPALFHPFSHIIIKKSLNMYRAKQDCYYHTQGYDNSAFSTLPPAPLNPTSLFSQYSIWQVQFTHFKVVIENIHGLPNLWCANCWTICRQSEFIIHDTPGWYCHCQCFCTLFFNRPWLRNYHVNLLMSLEIDSVASGTSHTTFDVSLQVSVLTFHSVCSGVLQDQIVT